MVTIVFAHPWDGSFNKVILDTIIAKCKAENKEYQVIDLHKDNFNPVYSPAELAAYSKGKYIDETIGKYQSMLNNTTEIVFIYPIWWSDMPAILKGFFDKVFLKDFAFNYEGGWNPLLKINKATVITTSEQETKNLETVLGDTVGNLVRGTLPSVGINNGVWINCDKITKGTDEHRKDFLKKVEATI